MFEQKDSMIQDWLLIEKRKNRANDGADLELGVDDPRLIIKKMYRCKKKKRVEFQFLWTMSRTT